MKLINLKYQKKRYNKEEINEVHKQYYKINKNRITEYKKLWYKQKKLKDEQANLTTTI